MGDIVYTSISITEDEKIGMDVKYSIAITIYNDEKSISTLLCDMLKQTVKPSEIVVADGGSTDNSAKLVREYAETVEIPLNVICGGRYNISEGLNMAIRNCQYEMIGIVATGNRYDTHFFEELIREKEKRQAEIAYAPIRGLSHNSFSKHYIHCFLQPGGSDYGIATNHGCLVDRKVFNKIGFFYERFIYAGEDAEFYTRARNKRIKCCCIRKAKMYWLVAGSMQEMVKQCKNYTIAEMQIHGSALIVKKIKQLIDTMDAILFSNKLNLTEKKIMLIYKLYPFVIMIKYMKYFGDKWRVKR